MPDSPLLSVIVPVYNTAQYLRRCLDSICNQNYSNLEIICVNDGSTDNSAEILKEYAAKDGRIKVFTQPNTGQSAARNKGLEHATGEWVTGVDSDDYLELDAYEYALGTAKDEVDIIIFGRNVIFEDINQQNTFTPGKTAPRQEIKKPDVKLLLQATVTFWDKLWRKSLIDKYQCRFPIGLWYEDNYFWWALAPYARTISYMPGRKINYVRRLNSIMTQTFQGTSRRLDLLGIAEYLQGFYSSHPLPASMRHTRITSFLYLCRESTTMLPPRLREECTSRALSIARQHGLFESYPAQLRFLLPTQWYLAPFVNHAPEKTTYGFLGMKIITIKFAPGEKITRFLGIKFRKKLS